MGLGFFWGDILNDCLTYGKIEAVKMSKRIAPGAYSRRII